MNKESFLKLIYVIGFEESVEDDLYYTYKNYILYTYNSYSTYSLHLNKDLDKDVVIISNNLKDLKSYFNKEFRRNKLNNILK